VLVAVSVITAVGVYAIRPSSVQIPRSAPPEALCESVQAREPCRELTYAGRGWRYTLLRAAIPTDRTAIVDFGGPGLALLGGSYRLGQLRTTYPALVDHNLLVLEEPWVLNHTPTGCDEALSAAYLAVRGGSAAAAGRTLRERCRLDEGGLAWGFDASTYRGLVAAIATREQLTVQGFVGHSWASVRLAYLGPGAVSWAVLSRPFPVGVAADNVIAARAALIEATFLGGAPYQADIAVGGRSLPVSAFDVASAKVALFFRGDEDIRRTVSQWREVVDPTLAGNLSDEFWMRYGQASVSPAMLAHVQETCRTVGPLGEPADAFDSSTVTGVLSAAFRLCGPRGPRLPLALDLAGTRTCLVSSAGDTVTPDALVRRFAATAGLESIVESLATSHSTMDGVTTCLGQVLGEA
jgi:hypothetical protein